MSFARLRRLLWVLGAFIVLCIVWQQIRCNAEDEGIQATPPHTPLLRTWIQTVDGGTIAVHPADVSPIGDSQIHGINWTRDPVTRLRAALYQNTALVSIETWGEHTLVTYLNAQGKQYQSPLQNITKGVLLPVGNSQMIAGITSYPYYLPGLKPGQAVNVRAGQNEQIEVMPLTREKIPAELGQAVDMVPDAGRLVPVVVSPLTGKVLCDAPVLDKRIAADYEGNIRQIGVKLIEGGIEELRVGGYGLRWDSKDSAQEKWVTTRMRIDRNYGRNLLPTCFQNTPVRIIEVIPELWKDGSIIFRYAWEESRALGQGQGNESLTFIALIRQPQKEHASLLTWEVYYKYTDLANLDTSRALSRVWYPVEDGTIQDAYPGTGQARNDLYFDIDPANNSIVFLRGGRLWKLAINK